jgi:hypothetical protein
MSADIFTGAQYASDCAAILIANQLETVFATLGRPIVSSYVYDEIVYSPLYTDVSTIFEPVQCDGSARISFSKLDSPTTPPGIEGTDYWFISGEDYVNVPTTLTSETIIDTQYYGIFFPPPTCSINPSDCQSLVTAFDSGFQEVIQSWNEFNTLSLSLASPPDSVLVNGRTTIIPDSPGTPYILTIHDQTYSPIYATESVYRIFDADIAIPFDRLLTPGGQLTVTWDIGFTDLYQQWAFDIPCDLPDDSPPPSCTESRCAIFVDDAQLLYFAPPPTARDICAETSPGFNRGKYSHSVASHL